MATTTTTVPMTMAATVEQLEARYKLWGAKINELEAAGESRRVQAKIDRRKRIDGLRAKYQLARAKLDELKAAGSDKWEGFRSGVESAGGELDAALLREEKQAGGHVSMVWIAALILVVLWGVALITSYTLGGYIHVLLLPALVIVALRLIRMRRRAV
jgi:Flp pilus assembly protein TadB